MVLLVIFRKFVRKGRKVKFGFKEIGDKVVMLDIGFRVGLGIVG